VPFGAPPQEPEKEPLTAEEPAAEEAPAAEVAPAAAEVAPAAGEAPAAEAPAAEAPEADASAADASAAEAPAAEASAAEASASEAPASEAPAAEAPAAEPEKPFPDAQESDRDNTHLIRMQLKRPFPQSHEIGEHVVSSIRGALYDLNHWKQLPPIQARMGTAKTLKYVVTRDFRAVYLLLFVSILVFIAVLVCCGRSMVTRFRDFADFKRAGQMGGGGK
jgi:hypothetical protein